MDPLTIASGVAALAGLGAAWRMHRRARRAEAEANTLRSVLLCQRGVRGPLPNQRPWRMAHPGAGYRAHPP